MILNRIIVGLLSFALAFLPVMSSAQSPQVRQLLFKGSSVLSLPACNYTPVTSGTQGSAYTGGTPVGSGGTPPYTFSNTGSLPTGITINSSTGVLSGTPTAVGVFPSIQVQVTDSLSIVANCSTAFTLSISPSGYQGPGDVVAGAAAWSSCARAYNVALALTSTLLCDLVVTGTTTVVCTLRGTTTGFVDLTLCSDGVTVPATACVGGCSVKKAYDQIGGTGGFIQATAASMPTLTFSALNGLPGMTFNSAANQTLSLASFTLAQPFNIAAVYKRTATNFNSGILSENGAALGLYGSGSADAVQLTAGTVTSLTGVVDNAFHAVQAVFNGNSPNTILAADGNSNFGSSGSGAFVGGVMRIGRGSSTLDGTIMQIGIWGSPAWTSTQQNNINFNDHVVGYGGF